MFLKRFLYYIATTIRDAIVAKVVFSFGRWVLILLGISPIAGIIFVYNIINRAPSEPDPSTPKPPTQISTIDDQNKPRPPVNDQPETLDKDSTGNKGRPSRARVNSRRQPKTRPPVSKPPTPANGQMLNEIKETQEGAKAVHQDYKRMLENAQEENRRIKEMSLRAERLKQLAKKAQGQ